MVERFIAGVCRRGRRLSVACLTAVFFAACWAPGILSGEEAKPPSTAPGANPAASSAQGVAGQTPDTPTQGAQKATGNAVYVGAPVPATPLAPGKLIEIPALKTQMRLSGGRVTAVRMPTSTEVQGQRHQLQITIGTSSLLNLSQPVSRISVTNPEIADALVITPSQVLINGVKPGVTNLILWFVNKQNIIYDLTIQEDISVLRRRLKKLFPDEQIDVEMARDAIILSGETSNEAVALSALDVAKAFAGKEKVDKLKVLSLINKHLPLTQISLKVHFAEVSRNALRGLGITVFYQPQYTSTGLPDLRRRAFVNPGKPFSPAQGTTFGSVDKIGPDWFLSEAVTFFLTNDRWDFGALIKALQSNGRIRTLAEPKLITMSGQQAEFLAGGEVPVPIVTNNQINIEYKEFGIQLKFLPRVLGKNLISLELAPEVSDLDFSRAVVLSGFTIPAITSRRVKTKVELRDGQTLAIAGLINSTSRRNLDKVPALGDVPILGTLFKSERFQREETELLVMVTPYLMRTEKQQQTREISISGFQMGRGF